MTKEKRIEEELLRISLYFEDIDENRKAVIKPLIQNSAFMKITLDDLQDQIASSGVVEHYQNGANQSGMKQSAALQSYNSLVKNYAAVTKTLFSLLPSMKRTAAYIEMQRRNSENEKIKQLEQENSKLSANLARAEATLLNHDIFEYYEANGRKSGT